MIDVALLTELAAEYGVAVSEAACHRFDAYAALLVEWNQKMNLTAITDPTEMVVKHFVDSLTALPLLPEKKGISLVDVGTGAGFPGVPLAILREDIELTLLDSLNKRLVFLQEVCRELGIPARFVHARAEEAGQRGELRERFDVATARAVASLPLLCEYCLPLVKLGGRFLALKGPDGESECAAAKEACHLLGGGKPAVTALVLPKTPREGMEQQERRLILISKERPTPKKYPRPSAKIAKQPW